MFIAKFFQSPKHTRWRRDEVQFVEIHKRAASCLVKTHQCNRADLLAGAETRRLLWLGVAKHAAAQRCDRASMLAGNEKHECRIRFESTLIARSPLPWSREHTGKQRPKAHAAKVSKKITTVRLNVVLERKQFQVCRWPDSELGSIYRPACRHRIITSAGVRQRS